MRLLLQAVVAVVVVVVAAQPLLQRWRLGKRVQGRQRLGTPRGEELHSSFLCTLCAIYWTGGRCCTEDRGGG